MTCASPSTLTNHIRYRHTKEKPFACEFCAYRGKTPADIKSHLRIHYNEVEMKCPEQDCEFTCRAKVTMKQHHLPVQALDQDSFILLAKWALQVQIHQGPNIRTIP